MIHVLREYALLADGERGVAVGPDGDFGWLCAPRWDSGSVFSSMVGGHGRYQVVPSGRAVWGGYYEPDSLIWRSRWITPDAEVECREALAFPGAPGLVVVLRQVQVLRGSAEIDVLLRPRADYDAAPFRTVHRTDDGWTGRAGDLHVRWSGDVAEATVQPDGHGGRQLQTTVRVTAGAPIDLVLELADHPFETAAPEATPAWAATSQGWARAMPDLATPVAGRDARHAWAVLRGLTGRSGAMVAAATTSLPERAEEGRNYDYRYAWIRDQCYAGVAAAAAGADDLLDAAVGFVTERLLDDGADLKPAYTVEGGRIPDQRSLDLPGYPGSSVRLGNHVNEQFQLDGFGEALMLLAAAADRDRLDDLGRKAAHLASDAIAARWQDADAGVWELDDRRWTHSRLSCVAGLRAIARAGVVDTNPVTALADGILAHQAAHCLHPSGRWQRSDDDERVDAALLLAAIRGAVAADDPRSIATLDAVRRDLSVDEYVYRYRIDERPLGQAEGAFLLCGFWMALACAQQGDHLAAARWFERSRSACGPPGLFTEEFDVGQRQLRGNFPQAFVHALLLECCATLDIETGLTP